MSGKLKKIAKKILIHEPNVNVNISLVKNDELLSGKNVLVTGGGRGLGFAIAKKIAALGGNVVITGRNPDVLKKAVKEIGGNCVFFQYDNSKVDGFPKLLKDAEEKIGKINCVVNNAGVSFHEANFLEVTESGWDDQMAINLKGTYFLCQAYVKYYFENKLGSAKIVNIASETAGQPSYRPYGISKAGIASFTKWLAGAYASAGIRVNAVAPGVTESDMTHAVTEGKSYNPGAPGKRFLKPEEIAETVAFLLSDASTCISGQIIACNEANVCFEN